MLTDDARSPPRRRLLPLLGLLAAALALPAPRAALAEAGRVRFPVAGMPGTGAYGPGVLDQDDLERCVMLEREINRGADALDAEETAVAARRAELERATREVEGKAAGADRGDRAAAKRHAGEAEQQRAAVNAFNARLPAFNARVQRHRARVGEFNAACAGNRYYDADMRTVRARLLLD